MPGQTTLISTTFDELQIGQSVSLRRTLSPEDIKVFAILSGDINPAHLDQDYASSTVFHGVVGHGMWSGALISALLGTQLPGPGTIYLNQNLNFKKPVRPGETIVVTVTVKEKRPPHPIVVMDCECTNSQGEVVVSGLATVLAPTHKIQRDIPELPELFLHYHDRYRDFMESCRGCDPIRAGVVHPVNELAIRMVDEIAKNGLMIPVLIGPKKRILQASEEAGIDVSAFQIVDAEHSHAAAALAVEMAAKGHVKALIKGNLTTEELLHAVVPHSAGLRTERRISHAYVMDVSTYHKPLIITDAAINIAPTLEQKADICQNSINLWRMMTHYTAEPKVAVLAAIEKVNSSMQATLDAACLCKMADRGQIKNALVDGPLALDLAISQYAVGEKGVVSSVAGDADILVVPDIQAGNMIAKQLTFLSQAHAAGIVLGARVPIVLTSRSDSLKTRMMSCSLALRLAHEREEGRLK